MQQYPSEVSLSGSLHFLVPPNPSIFSDHFSNMMNINSTSTTTPNYNNNFIDHNHLLYNNNFQFPSDQYHHEQLQNIGTYSNQYLGPCLSNNSTSDEAEEAAGGGQQSLINERKQRRMISNRESARRSRMRKQKHLDELWSQVVWLRNENHHLMDKLHHVSDRHDEVIRENSILKEEASKLQQMFSDLGSPTIRDLDSDIVDIDTPAYLRAESSSTHSNITTY